MIYFALCSIIFNYVKRSIRICWYRRKAGQRRLLEKLGRSLFFSKQANAKAENLLLLSQYSLKSLLNISIVVLSYTVRTGFLLRFLIWFTFRWIRFKLLNTKICWRIIVLVVVSILLCLHLRLRQSHHSSKRWVYLASFNSIDGANGFCLKK